MRCARRQASQLASHILASSRRTSFKGSAQVIARVTRATQISVLPMLPTLNPRTQAAILLCPCTHLLSMQSALLPDTHRVQALAFWLQDGTPPADLDVKTTQNGRDYHRSRLAGHVASGKAVSRRVGKSRSWGSFWGSSARPGRPRGWRPGAGATFAWMPATPGLGSEGLPPAASCSRPPPLPPSPTELPPRLLAHPGNLGISSAGSCTHAAISLGCCCST